MVIPPEERFSVQEKKYRNRQLPSSQISAAATRHFLLHASPAERTLPPVSLHFFPALFLSDVFFPAMTVYKDRRLPAASPGDRSPIWFLSRADYFRPQKTDCREKVPVLIKQKGVPVFRRENRSCRRLFSLLFPIKNPRRLGSRRELSKRENQLVVFCMK